MTELTNENFEENTKDGVVLVDFWASWCGPCRMLGPIIETVSKSFEDDDSVNVYKMDVDQAQELAGKYEVTAVPTMVFLKNGELVDKISGVQPAGVITKALQDLKEL